MFFKNLTVFQLLEVPEVGQLFGPAGELIRAAHPLSLVALRSAVEDTPPRNLMAFEVTAQGWSPEVTEAGGAFILTLEIADKVLPAATVKQRVAELAKEVTNAQGFPCGRRQLREFKEKARTELLAKAFTKRTQVRGLLDPVDNWLIVDTPSSARADRFAEALRDLLGSLKVRPIDTAASFSSKAAVWIQAPADAVFTVEDELELQTVDKTRATVKYRGVELQTGEIRAHLVSKLVTKLGVSWRERAAFSLNDNLQLRRFRALLDVKDEGDEELTPEDLAQAQAIVMVGEFRAILADLVAAMGGLAVRS